MAGSISKNEWDKEIEEAKTCEGPATSKIVEVMQRMTLFDSDEEDGKKKNPKEKQGNADSYKKSSKPKKRDETYCLDYVKANKSQIHSKSTKPEKCVNFNDLEKQDRRFQRFLRQKFVMDGNITEVYGDLFSVPDDFALAHCVGEDFRMGSGIALTFKTKFKQINQLLAQKQSTGGLAFLNDRGRFIYYLVTKKHSRGKPTLYTLWLSLLMLREHCVDNEVRKLAIPQLGCGLDQLDWLWVKPMIAYVFRGTRVKISVYIWKQTFAPKRRGTK